MPPLHLSEPPTTKENTPTRILYPTEAQYSQVPLDVPVKLVILGSKQVGKSALALRYLTKNQCDTQTKGKILRYRKVPIYSPYPNHRPYPYYSPP